MGLIRTKTFIKYARINLQEAEAALQTSDYEKCAKKVIFCTDALIKAVAAALPMVKADFFAMTESRFAKHLEDLASDLETPKKVATSIFEARRLASAEADLERQMVEQALGHAGAAFTCLHELFVHAPL